MKTTISIHLNEQALGLFNEIPHVLFFVKDKKGVLIYANELLAKHCGFENAEHIIGKKDTDIFPQDLSENFNLYDQKVKETGKTISNIIEIFPDYFGNLDWFSTTKAPYYDCKGNVAGICGICYPYEDSTHYINTYGNMGKALNYLKEHFHEKTSNEVLAKEAGLSIRQFEKRFKQLFDCSPHHYIIRLRILSACKLLLSDGQSIAEIAFNLGFYDQSAFTKHFNKIVGLTPKDYIKKNRLPLTSRFSP